MLSEHVALELECIDRMYLNLYVPMLQTPEGSPSITTSSEVVTRTAISFFGATSVTPAARIVTPLAMVSDFSSA